MATSLEKLIKDMLKANEMYGGNCIVSAFDDGLIIYDKEGFLQDVISLDN